MLGRVVAFAVVLSALAVAAPQLAPNLLLAALHSGADTKQAARPAPPPPQPPLARSDDPDRWSLRRAVLNANAKGHFVADATINGRSVAIMVDTGATVVALSDATARRLGIYPPPGAFSERMTTANGVVMAARVTLSEVRLGAVAVRNVAAAVVPGAALPVDLLGMSFLGRLAKFEIANGKLVLSQ